MTSDRVEQLDPPAEVFYRRLMNKVDDHGLYDARPSVLRSSLYPLRVDRVREADISRWIAACEKAGLIALYKHDGKPFLQMLDTRWIARSEPKFPLRTVENTCAQLGTPVPVVGVGVGVEDGGDKRAGAPPPSRSKERKTDMPADFGISDRVKVWAAEKGFGQLPEHLDAFRRKAAAKGYTYVDWDAAFMEAVREDWAKLRGRAPNGAAPPPDAPLPKGPDPALAKIVADAALAVKPPEGIRAQMKTLASKGALADVSHGTRDAA